MRGRYAGGPPWMRHRDVTPEQAAAWLAHGPSWRPPHAVTLWVPVLLSFALQVPFALWTIGHEHRTGWRAIVVLVLAVLGPLALTLARRFPGPVVAVVSAAACADLLVNLHGGPPYVSLAFALVGAIVRGARVWAYASIAAAWVLTVVLGLSLAYPWPPGRIAFVTIGLIVVLGIAEGIRTRRDRYDRLRAQWRQRRQDEVQAERVRIARELHDVLAHSLSQINVQAGVGLHLMERQPEKAAEALQSIKTVSKTALEEVRGVLGVLRAEDGADPAARLVPEPDLARLSGLAASMAGNGLEVELDDRSDAGGAVVGSPIPQAAQLAVYRVAQEALTNVLRHSEARRARLTVVREPGAIAVTVEDDGPAAHAPRLDPGRGLLGMHERAELLGGRFEAGPSAAGGWRVAATFPIEEDPR